MRYITTYYLACLLLGTNSINCFGFFGWIRRAIRARNWQPNLPNGPSFQTLIPDLDSSNSRMFLLQISLQVLY
jgi:hypothetical protein